MIYFAHGDESLTTPKVSNESLAAVLVVGALIFVALVIGILIAQKRANVSSKPAIKITDGPPPLDK